ncbi:interleukin-18 receptor 1 [Alligator sinensis]|uniref:Interleukin-18 receptor 1 n=1 Tax=Alligator sinensis TaxID=38654 RepID=A0A3Q0HA85_ALLSI|nr:interleukin-18 receptor 1 [Alligator sinensis]
MELLLNCTFHTLTTEGELNFNTLRLSDSGIYTCRILITHEGKVFYTTSTTNLKVKKDTPEFVIPKITEPTEAYIETKTGKDEVLNCTVFRGYSVALNVMFYWLINDKHAEQCSDSTNCTCQGNYEYFNLGNELYASKRLWIKKVTDEDMNHNYTCILIVPGKMQKQTVRLKKGNISDLPPHLFTTGVIVAILSSCVAVLLVVLGGIFRVDLVLLYRDITGKDETVGDGKEYDAFVSYLKDCITTNDGEGKFALEILPKTLEEHFGYKLCIFERDITPGGAVVDDVLSFIDKSRRLIVILSKNYVSDKVMYELESGLHKALVERKIKIILIEYMPISDYNFLPKSLALLPSWTVVQWKKDQSLPLNSRFWKNLRYLMPAKTFKSNSGSPNNFLELVSEQETQSLTACWKTKTFI